MSWCFAAINNRLAEIFFDEKKGQPVFWGHCYVKRSEYKTKREQNQIKKDTAKVKLVFRKGEYKNKLG